MTLSSPRLIALVAVLAALVTNVARVALGWDSSGLRPPALAFASLLVVGAVLAVAGPLDRRTLGLVPVSVRAAAAPTGLVTAVLVSCAILTAPVLRLPTAGQLVGALALFGLCTGPAEELVFRGLLYGAMVDRWGAAPAVLVSAIAFAAVHIPVYGWSSLPVAFAAGLLLGWLRWVTGSLAPAWAAHVLADSALLLL